MKLFKKTLVATRNFYINFEGKNYMYYSETIHEIHFIITDNC